MNIINKEILLQYSKQSPEYVTVEISDTKVPAIIQVYSIKPELLEDRDDYMYFSLAVDTARCAIKNLIRTFYHEDNNVKPTTANNSYLEILHDVVSNIYYDDTKVIYIGLDGENAFRFAIVLNENGDSHYYNGQTKIIYFTISRPHGAILELVTRYIPRRVSININNLFITDKDYRGVLTECIMDQIKYELSQSARTEIDDIMSMNPNEYMLKYPNINIHDMKQEIEDVYNNAIILIHSITKDAIDGVILLNSDLKYLNYRNRDVKIIQFNIEQENE